MPPRKPARKPDPDPQPLVEVLDERVLTDNVAKDGKTYPAGTPLSDLPPLLRKAVLTNPTLFRDAEDDDGDNG